MGYDPQDDFYWTNAQFRETEDERAEIDHDELVAILMMADDAGADPEYVLKNQRAIVAQVRAGAVHDGDCTKQAHTCFRCLVENYDEIVRAAMPFIARALASPEKAAPTPPAQDEFDEERQTALKIGGRALADRLYRIPTTTEEQAETIILAARLLERAATPPAPSASPEKAAPTPREWSAEHNPLTPPLTSGPAWETPPAADARWVAIDEKGNDNFATSIYENDYDGLLVARCNQNGNHPWQAAAILRGLERNRQATPPAASDLRERAWTVLGQTCSYTGTTVGAKVVERVAAEFAAIRAEAKAEGRAEERDDWMSCARVDVLMEGPKLKGWNAGLLTRLWHERLAANRPSPTGREG